MPLFLQLRLFRLFSSFDCRFTCDEPSNWRKNEPRGPRRSRMVAKWSPIGPRRKIRGKASGPKWAQKRSLEEVLGLGRTELTKGWPWGPPRLVGAVRPCVLGGTAVRPGLLGIFPFSSCLFVFVRVFSGFCPYNRMYLDTLGTPNTTPFQTPFHLLSLE